MLRRRKMETVKEQSSCARYYDNKIKSDAEFYEKEKKRVMDYMRNRYATDEEYRNRVKEQKKQSYHRRKALKNQIPSVPPPVQVN